MTPHSTVRTLRRFADDRRGALAPAFALMTVALVGMAGIGFDYGTTTRNVLKIQSAADTAVLAAARLNDADTLRPAIAQRYFEAQLGPDTLPNVKSASFTLSADGNTITANINIQVPMKVASIVGVGSMSATVTTKAAIAKPDVRQLDLVFCIDATGSMSNTLTAVKNNALNLESNLNDELVRRGIPKFDAMRVRAIYYRDYGGNYMNGTSSYNVTYWNGTKYATKTSKPTDSDYWTYVGDVPPMKASNFYNLPAERTTFQGYVNPETANGGGDTPESGLECVNEAIDSPWAKVGDTPSTGGTKPLDAVYPTVVVWTDAAAHKPSYSLSLKNPNYPAATKMPRTYADLKAKWDSAAKIDQTRKLLVFFGNPDLSTNDRDGLANGWQTIKQWPGFMVGGTLTDGNSNMVTKLADAIASKVRVPTLTQ
ncbi:TadE/TadG family type IV pilus assembly protein [uncultured Alsobacter sp.]|uniref:TadE/TadG family type IV pilus assembly protein n=1 Tax=uncultured Alsobacter sp. TaxID=1748258 RepID=UPI0025E83C0F|nr:pilus assembly protein TadG-related protein [uncultured Alsobacter sp.]